jgi:LPPG:FO 2-phospho-L-lactate transferase
MKSDTKYKARVTIFSGGVGGAKLARGFASALRDHDIRIIVNTADDDMFYGLHVCPDIDTVMYHLAGIYNREQGWGLKDESFNTLNQLSKLGEDVWFKLGDKDLATHIIRTDKLKQGETLTEVTRHISKKLGVMAEILPMSNDPVRTLIISNEDVLPFQEYFVKRRCQVNVDDVRFEGVENAQSSTEVLDAIGNADLIVFAPSNPIVSVLPILELNGIRQMIVSSEACKVAVSPLIGQKALKGPAAELMPAFNLDASAVGVAEFYQGLIGHLFIHEDDEEVADNIEGVGITPVFSDIIMHDMAGSIRLAKEIFSYFKQVRGVGHEDA